jgi:hypothetical protein
MGVEDPGTITKMRTVVLLLLFAFIGSGCSNKGDASPSVDPAAVKAQQELVARRDKLMEDRKKLENQRNQIETEIKVVTEKGGDTTDLVKKKTDIDTKIQGTSSDLTSMDSKIDQMISTQTDVSGRETQIALREKDLARREKELADRESKFVFAQVESAKMWKEQCNTGGGPMIVLPPPSKGGNYGRSDVDGIYNRAKNVMRQKGLLASDLGPGASLEGEAQAAMSKGEWAPAFHAATQLLRYAEAIKIDKAFISAKLGRLNARVKSMKADDALQKQLDTGLNDVTSQYMAGNHNAANARLNQLYALVK